MAIEKVVLSPLGLNLLHSVKFAINLAINHYFFKNHERAYPSQLLSGEGLRKAGEKWEPSEKLITF